MPIPPQHAPVFSLLLFSVGIAGVLTRRNAIIILMSIELMMNAANINFIAFGLRLHSIAGQVFSVFTIAVGGPARDAACSGRWSGFSAGLHLSPQERPFVQG